MLIAGFAGWGWPEGLISALGDSQASGLTVVYQGSWRAQDGYGHETKSIEDLLAGRQVTRLVSPLPFYPGDPGPVEARWKSGDLEIEVTPPGVLAERLRAGGAGLGGVFLPAGDDNRFGEGLERRVFSGQDYVFQAALRADFALLRAHRADTMGNLVFQATQRNWNPVMAMAAEVSVVEVDEILEPGGLDPELVITPGIFVDRIVQTI